jgi:hypothetical protein
MTGQRAPKSKVRPHLFVVDPDVPGCCARCHLPGAAGDAHHTLPPAGDAQDEHRRRAGEGGS